MFELIWILISLPNQNFCENWVKVDAKLFWSFDPSEIVDPKTDWFNHLIPDMHQTYDTFWNPNFKP